MILIYDTETTGIPLWQEPSEHPDQPHITQLAAQLCDENNGTIQASMNVMIRPTGWTIPDDLACLTGITTERAAACGVSMDMAVGLFLEMWRKADVRVAHIESFDASMIRIELKRMHETQPPNMVDLWKEGTAFCTANASKPILQLPPTEKMLNSRFRNQFKTPNLGEAYRHFMGKDFTNAHNAAADLMACKAVYFAIKTRNNAPAPAADPVEA